MEALAKAGRVDAASAVSIARAGYGVAVRADASKPDVSTVSSVTPALRNAGSMSCSPDSNSSAYFVSLLDKLGLSDLKGRLKPVAGPTVVEAVAKGDADRTVITVPNIVAERGVQLAGRKVAL